MIEKREQWNRVKALFDAAVERGPAERDAFLRQKCGEDRALRAEVESLLSAYEKAGDLSAPVWHEQPVRDIREQKIIGPYQLAKKLGEGGMGQVWLAEQTAPVRRQVALKLIKGGMFESSALQRFQSERQSLAIMDHPSIAKVFDAGATLEGQPYFVMEYVPGVPITDYCDQKKLKIPERLELFIKVCEAIQHAHQKAIIHRDLKPANILVVEGDGKPLPRIIDFGLAKGTTPEVLGEDAFTRAGSFLGTPGYVSPEQADPGASDVDTRTDVYSLGAVLYVLLTGSLPFESQEKRKRPLDEVLRQLREDDPPRPSTKAVTRTETSQATAEARGVDARQLAGLLRGDLDWITMKALERDRARRYATPGELAADLRHYLLHEPVSARPASVSYRAGKFVRRNRTVVALASLAFAALIAGVTGTLIQAQQARVQRDFAFRQLSRAEAFTDLENFLLADAAPSGKPFTVDDLLNRAEKIVERERVADADRVDMMVSIGRQYSGRDLDAKALSVLDHAYQISRGLPDLASRASAACAFGGALGYGGNSERAEALFQEGMQEVPAEPQYVLIRIACLLRGREIAGARGDARSAVERAEQANQLLEHSGFDSRILQLRASMDLAEAYRDAARFPDAIRTFEKVSAQLTDLGRDNTDTAATLYNNWALALLESGRPLEAEKLFRRAIDTTRADNGEAGVSPMIILNYGKSLRDLGRLDEAADYARRALDQAKQAGHQVVIHQSMIELMRIYRMQRDFPRALDMLGKVEPILRRGLPPGHYAFAALQSERSLIAQGYGDLAKALQLASEAVTMDEAAIKSGGLGANVLPLLLFRRSAVEVELHQADKAVADAQRAVSLLRESAEPGAYSVTVGRALMALGHALQAQGKSQEAQAAFRTAAENLEKTVGIENPEAQATRQLASLGSQ